MEERYATLDLTRKAIPFCEALFAVGGRDFPRHFVRSPLSSPPPIFCLRLLDLVFLLVFSSRKPSRYSILFVTKNGEPERVFLSPVVVVWWQNSGQSKSGLWKDRFGLFTTQFNQIYRKNTARVEERVGGVRGIDKYGTDFPPFSLHIRPGKLMALPDI